MTILFADRHDAGRRLAARLAAYAGPATLVLALPRGGVPVAWEVAHALAAPLDVLIVRKIGAPGHAELGIGAVVDADPPEVMLDERLARMTGADADYVAREVCRQEAEIARRRALYAAARHPIPPAGRDVILVDDGIATGATARAALAALARAKPRRLVLAVPVAAAESLAALAGSATLVCLATPAPFHAVGEWYADFGQTSDDVVVRLLAAAVPGAPA